MAVQTTDLGVLAEAHLTERKVSTLSIPEELAPVINEQAFAFEQDLMSLQQKVQKAKSEQKFDCEYPLIDCSFLSMKGQGGWPRFAVYGLNNAVCSLGARVSFESNREPVELVHNIPDALARHYQPFFIRLADLAYRGSVPFHTIKSSTTTITAPFRGVIPMEQRQFLTTENRRRRFDSISLIAEAPEWKLHNEIVHMPVSKDPLIIGVKGKECFLLGKFDVTTIEEYVAKEFTS